MTKFVCATIFVSVLCVATTAGAQTTFDVERAIRTTRAVDLGELATAIEYIPLEYNLSGAMLADIRWMAESKTGFYIGDHPERAVKFFDRRGRWIGLRGSIGRGPGEFTSMLNLAADYERDMLYVIVSSAAQTPVLAYDADGKFVARTSVPLNLRDVAFHDGNVIALQRSPHRVMAPPSQSTIGDEVPFVEIFSPALEHRQTIEIVDKGSGMIAVLEGGGTPETLRSINLLNQSLGVLASNGLTLTVKDERGDVAYHFQGGRLVPAHRLDQGRYTVPDNLYGQTYSPDIGDYYQTQRLIESERYIFLASRRTRDGEAVQIVLDKTAPGGGLTAVGPRGEAGLFLGGVKFTPMYVRDGRLVGWMSAIDIVDNAAAITNPNLRALAAGLREDSNPVIVVATLKK